MKTRADKIAEAEAAGLAFPYPDPPAHGEAIEVAPSILWARLPLPMALDHVNIYLLQDEDGWTIIDTGMDTPPCRAAWEKLFAGPLAGQHVARVLITHFHPDHVGLAGWLCARTGATLIANRTSFLYARMLQLDAWDEAPEEAVRFYQAAGYGEAEMTRMRERAKYGFSRVCHPLPVGFKRIAEGQTIRLAGRDWRVHFGHGHAPDHTVLACEADGLVIAGDQVLPRITSNIGVYPTEPEGDPLGDWLTACAALRDTLPAKALILPGHNEPFRGVDIRLTQLLDHHATGLDSLTAFLSEPRRAVDCFGVLFDREITTQLLGFATIEAIAHLNHLEATGRALRETCDGVNWFRVA